MRDRFSRSAGLSAAPTLTHLHVACAPHAIGAR
jgi:hypothetical protein